MKSVAVTVTAAFLLTAPAVAGQRGGAVADPPHVLFVLADDLAWSDLGCYGHPWHETPHLDALAQAGMRFTDAYAPAPICSAARASILTGKTTARLNFEFVTKRQPGRQEIDAEVPLRAPPLTLNLPLAEQTIPEYLAPLGYVTAFYGKWHVSAHHQRYLGWSPTHGPRQQGFARAVEDFGSHPYAWGQRSPGVIKTPGEFPRDSMIERASRFLEQPREQPFFLMVSTFYVHTPVRSPCQWLLDKYEQKVPENSPNRKKRVAYAAFVETLDHHVGRLLRALDRSGQREDTLVVFTSDNGGHPEYTANAPLRGSKWNLYEGGIRVPLIMRLPKRIAAGSTCSTPAVGYDLLPTFVELAGGQAAAADGVSLVPLIDNPNWQPNRNLVWHFPYYHPETGFANAQETIGINDFAVSETRPQSALRRGRYKLLRFYEDDRLELYDLDTDLGEQRDLATRRTVLAERLAGRLRSQLERMNARQAEPTSEDKAPPGTPAR